MKKLIYSKRYCDDIEDFFDDFDIQLPEIEKHSPEEIKAIIQKITFDLENNSTYEPIAGREQVAERAISIAKYVSGYFKIDTDIIRRIDCYEIVFYIKQMPIVSAVKKSYAALFGIADEAYIHSDIENGYDHRCHFTIKTHKHLVNGKEVGFYNE